MKQQLTKSQRIRAAAHYNVQLGAPCPNCGRSIGRHLELREAYAVFHYATTDCAVCLLTDHPRPGAIEVDDGDGGQWSGL